MNQPQQVILRRPSSQAAWGFRLQGGADFDTPLSVQQVNAGGVAESCGIQAGDAVLAIEGRSSDEISHDEAKYVIGSAESQITLLIQRGSVSVWQPKVMPVSTGYGVTPGSSQYIQQTSLAANHKNMQQIGGNYNNVARPFPGSGQYIYAPDQGHASESYTSTQQPRSAFLDNKETAAGFRSVRAPSGVPSNVQLERPQNMMCQGCQQLVTGVFVKISGNPWHPKCFSCHGCGRSLKNQGHYTVEGQLFCETCAQQRDSAMIYR